MLLCSKSLLQKKKKTALPHHYPPHALLNPVVARFSPYPTTTTYNTADYPTLSNSQLHLQRGAPGLPLALLVTPCAVHLDLLSWLRIRSSLFTKSPPRDSAGLHCRSPVLALTWVLKVTSQSQRKSISTKSQRKPPSYQRVKSAIKGLPPTERSPTRSCLHAPPTHPQLTCHFPSPGPSPIPLHITFP